MITDKLKNIHSLGSLAKVKVVMNICIHTIRSAPRCWRVVSIVSIFNHSIDFFCCWPIWSRRTILCEPASIKVASYLLLGWIISKKSANVFVVTALHRGKRRATYKPLLHSSGWEIGSALSFFRSLLSFNERTSYQAKLSELWEFWEQIGSL